MLPIGKADGALLVTVKLALAVQLSDTIGEPKLTLVEVHATLVVPEAAAGAEIVGF